MPGVGITASPYSKDFYDEPADEVLFGKIYSTNLIYQRPELLEREWYGSVEKSMLICGHSISALLDPPSTQML